MKQVVSVLLLLLLVLLLTQSNSILQFIHFLETFFRPFHISRLFLSLQYQWSYMLNRSFDKMNFYTSSKTTLQLLNIQIASSFQYSPLRPQNFTHLSRQLRQKNVGLAILHCTTAQVKASKEANFDRNKYQSSAYQNLDQLKGRVSQELQRVRQGMQEASIKKIQVQKNKNKSQQAKLSQIIKRQSKFNEIANICCYFQEIGEVEAGKFANQMEMFGQSREPLNQLIQCFKQILHTDEPFYLFNNTPSNPKPLQINIRQYRELFEQILQQRERKVQNDTENSTFLNLPCSKFSPSLANNSFFVGIELLIQSTLKKHQTDQSKHIISEKQGLIRFLQQQEQQNKDTKFYGNLTPANFWQRLLCLIRRGPKFNDFIGIHLLQFKELELYEYFKAVVNGRSQTFSKNLVLFNTNKHYREFLMILEGQYSKKLIQSNELIGQEQVAAVVAEMLLSTVHNQNLSLQLQVIKKYNIELAKKVKWKLQRSYDYQSVQPEIKKMVFFGQLTTLLKLFIDCHKINAVEALLLIAKLSSVDLACSDLLFFTPQLALQAYQQYLRQTMRMGEKVSFQQLQLFSKVFLSIGLFQKPFTDKLLQDILTENHTFLEYILESKNFEEYLLHFGIAFDSLPAFLQAAMSKHKSYSYCFQFSLSIAIPLTEYFQLCFPMPISMVGDQSNLVYNEGSCSPLQRDFCTKGLRYRQFLQKNVNPFTRFAILINMIKHLQKTNIDILECSQKNQKLYRQIVFCNQLLSNLSQKKGIQLLWKHLALQKADQQKSTQVLLNQLLNLAFTFSLLKLRFCITKGRFEEMIDLFNQFIDHIAVKFLAITESLERLLKEGRGKVMGLRYLGELTQCLILIKAEKSKVISRNRYLFKVLCSQISQLLKGLKEQNKEEVQLIQRHIKKTTNEIINL